MVKRPKMGQRVRVTQKLRRMYVGASASKIAWQRLSPLRWRKPKDGIYIGHRSLSNGHFEHNADCYEPHSYYVNDERFTAWVVVFSERQNPVYVHPEDVTILDDDTQVD